MLFVKQQKKKQLHKNTRQPCIEQETAVPNMCEIQIRQPRVLHSVCIVVLRYP